MRPGLVKYFDDTLTVDWLLVISSELAVENITRELAALHERESKVAVEAASKKLTSQMKEENEKALKKAVEQAKVL